MEKKERTTTVSIAYARWLLSHTYQLSRNVAIRLNARAYSPQPMLSCARLVGKIKITRFVVFLVGETELG